ncbi:cation:proton antiporter [Microbacterium schleiferi]|uniref:Sodium:proton antiporter n=1 Tax=Microbacterium schleiferi TaxID=69362 RepID=A0ABU7V481_9MICO
MTTTEAFLFVIGGVLVVAMTARVAPRIRVAGPLLLVLIGIVASYLPFLPDITVNPEWILVGVLPPLLYSAAVSLPAVEFRRDLLPIAGLAVVLVFVSSFVLGTFFYVAIPDLGYPLALALGAILSPTDAVATAVAKRLGVSRRVVTMLEGESLLNDASALVILNSAVAAFVLIASTGQPPPLIDAVGGFFWAVFIAIVIGAIVGYANLRLRSWLRSSAATTAAGFIVPFVAYLPTEELGGSGLVAAVVAGIVTGQGAARWFTPEQRMSDHVTWRTVELILEGGVFLIMGLEMSEIVTGTANGIHGIAHGLWIAGAAFGILLAVRAGYVTLLVWGQGRRLHPRRAERLNAISDRIDEIEAGGPQQLGDRGRRITEAGWNRRLAIFRRRISRAMSDLNYYRTAPLGWKHGTIIVWSGMRGVVTLAAAQTLPADAPSRHFLIFVAFTVALTSLMLQGFTLPALVRLLRVSNDDDENLVRSEQQRIVREMHQAALLAAEDGSLTRRDGSSFAPEFTERVGPLFLQAGEAEDDEARDILELRLALIRVRRERLIELSGGGQFGSAALRRALAELDASQLNVELRLESAD